MAVSTPDVDVETAVNADHALKHCADLANRSKHLTLTSVRVNADKKKGAKIVAVVGHQSSVAYRYSIKSNRLGGKDALELAGECMVAWERLLDKWGLPR